LASCVDVEQFSHRIGSNKVLAHFANMLSFHASCLICTSGAILLFHVVRPMLGLAAAYMGPSDNSNTHQTNLETVLCLQAIFHPFTESWKTIGTTSNLTTTLCTSGEEPLRLCCMRSFKTVTGWCRQM